MLRLGLYILREYFGSQVWKVVQNEEHTRGEDSEGGRCGNCSARSRGREGC
jgi:hypothetical protein